MVTVSHDCYPRLNNVLDLGWHSPDENLAAARAILGSLAAGAGRLDVAAHVFGQKEPAVGADALCCPR